MNSGSGGESGRGDHTPGTPSGRFHAAGRKGRGTYVKAGALLLLVLLAGVAIGVGGTICFFKNTRRQAKMPSATQIGESILSRLEAVAPLQPDERARIETIVRDHMTRVDESRHESMRTMRNEFDAMNDGIDAILGEERSKAWEADKRNRYGEFYRGRDERHSDFSRRVPDGRGQREKSGK